VVAGRVAVYDALDNPSTPDRRVTVDKAKTKVAFAKVPRNAANAKGSVKVTATASDRNGVARVQLLINGEVVATDTTSAYSFSINTRKHGNKIKGSLRAYDKAGNVTTTSTRTWSRS
jgi:archaellum component FlaF (FlaF/FlaG flagellin family)